MINSRKFFYGLILLVFTLSIISSTAVGAADAGFDNLTSNSVSDVSSSSLSDLSLSDSSNLSDLSLSDSSSLFDLSLSDSSSSDLDSLNDLEHYDSDSILESYDSNSTLNSSSLIEGESSLEIANTTILSEDANSTVFTITEKNYSKYFDSKGNLNNSLVSIGDTIDLSGNFSNKSFIFTIPLTVTSLNSDSYLYNCQVAFINITNYTESAAVISNLNMTTIQDWKLMIVVNNSCNVSVINNVIFSSGTNSYPISLVDNAVESLVRNNTIKTVVSNRFAQNVDKNESDNSSWQHSGITLLDSYNNTIDSNDITVEDSYGIYLCFGMSTSDYNNITNNTIRSSIENVSFWAYGIYLMGKYNLIANNTIIGMYRGVSAADAYNVIVGNKIYNITGIDVDTSLHTGGDYAIYGSNNALIANNSIYKGDVSKAGIIVGFNSEAYGNYIEITSNASGIVIGSVEGGSNGDSNFNVSNNTIKFHSGYGILIDGYPNNVTVYNNNINSLDEDNRSGWGDGVGIYVIYQSRYKKPANVSIEYNKIFTNNDCAINLSDCSLEYVCEDNDVFGKLIILPVSDNKSSINGTGKTFTVNDNNFYTYFNTNGTLKSPVNDGDTIILEGKFSQKGQIILDKSINLIGKNAVLTNTTICVYSSGCTISNLTIINNGTKKCNLWGIYVYEADNATIVGNNISVWDRNTSYGIYLCDSRDNNISNNTIWTQGDELVFSLLNYEVYDSIFEANDIQTIGTGNLYPYIETISIDGVHSISELSKTYGVIFDYSSDNTFIHNDINVTSTVEGVQVPYQPSVNILIGLYIYYDSNRNNISENNVFIEGHDPFLYGLGCSGDDTSKSSTTADNNIFKDNNVTIIGDYFDMGIILRHNSMGTVIDNNSFNLTANNYTYGIDLEISGFSNVTNNQIHSTASGNYAVELYSSWGNYISGNTLYANGSYAVGPALYSSSDNILVGNAVVAISNTEIDPGMALEHPDSVKLVDTGISLQKGSKRNIIINNTVTTNSDNAVDIDETSSGNVIANNTFNANGKSGDAAVYDRSGKNTISGNTGKSTKGMFDGSPSKNNSISTTKSNTNVNMYSNSSSAYSGGSGENGASAYGAIDSGLVANAKSSADSGSGDAGISGEAANGGELTAKEINAVESKSAYSPYAVPLILLFFGALFCYSFLASKNEDDDDEHLY